MELRNKLAKHSKLYKDSPSIEKDDDGKPGIKRPSKADAESMGTEGNPLEGAGDGMPVGPDENEDMANMHDRHARELKDTHKRHEDEVKDMHKRHAKEAKKLSGGSSDKQEEKKD